MAGEKLLKAQREEIVRVVGSAALDDAKAGSGVETPCVECNLGQPSIGTSVL